MVVTEKEKDVEEQLRMVTQEKEKVMKEYLHLRLIAL